MRLSRMSNRVLQPVINLIINYGRLHLTLLASNYQFTLFEPGPSLILSNSSRSPYPGTTADLAPGIRPASCQETHWLTQRAPQHRQRAQRPTLGVPRTRSYIGEMVLPGTREKGGLSRRQTIQTNLWQGRYSVTCRSTFASIAYHSTKFCSLPAHVDCTEQIVYGKREARWYINSALILA